MSKKLHAENNERLCLQLNEQGAFNDWTITTAFYSALHYVQNEIFPFDDGMRNYINFDSYYNSITGRRRPSKHKTTIHLVFDHLPDAGDSYKWLHDTCRTARYHNYNMSKAFADKAISHLNNIKESLAK